MTPGVLIPGKIRGFPTFRDGRPYRAPRVLIPGKIRGFPTGIRPAEPR